MTIFFGLIFTNGILIIQGLLNKILMEITNYLDLQFCYFKLSVFGSLTLVCAFVAFGLEEAKITRLSFQKLSERSLIALSLCFSIISSILLVDYDRNVLHIS